MKIREIKEEIKKLDKKIGEKQYIEDQTMTKTQRKAIKELRDKKDELLEKLMETKEYKGVKFEIERGIYNIYVECGKCDFGERYRNKGISLTAIKNHITLEHKR